MDTDIIRPGAQVWITRVGRVSRYTLIALAARKEAVAVGAAILRAMHPHREKVLRMTYDKGKESGHHVLLADLLDANAYFLHPCHSWKRGLNKNTNSLIRQYFPTGKRFAGLTDEDVALVQNKLSSRPRKYIDYATPNDIFAAPPPTALAACIRQTIHTFPSHP